MTGRGTPSLQNKNARSTKDVLEKMGRSEEGKSDCSHQAAEAPESGKQYNHQNGSFRVKKKRYQV